MTVTHDPAIRRVDTSAIEAKYTGAVIDELLSKTRVEASQDVRREFVAAIHQWAGVNWLELQSASRQPSGSHIAEELKTLQRMASDLRCRLAETSDAATIALWRAADPSSPEKNGHAKLANAEHVVSQIEVWADDASLSPDARRRGPQAKSSRVALRREAVRELAEIWKRITGNKPTRRVHKGDHATKAGRPYGPFFEFVSLALRPIFGVEPETGIDADIRRVCASMEKSPW